MALRMPHTEKKARWRPRSSREAGDRGARTRLLEAATALFAERGYAGTSVGEIVTRAGVTKPVLYYYFHNKEGIFQAILEEAARLQEEVIGEVLSSSGHVLERLALLFDRVYRGVSEHPDLMRTIHALTFAQPQASPAFDLEPMHRAMVEAIKAIYSHGVSHGEVAARDPEEVAYLVLSVLSFCLDLDHTLPGLADPERPARLLRLAFRGLEPRGE
ncbi:MAG: TetR family transcriptional regulator [Thermodesulfobacteriota bacterium]